MSILSWPLSCKIYPVLGEYWFMQFREFLQKNNIVLPKTIKSICTDGLKLMKKSVDPLHKEDHIFRILDSLDSLLKYNSKIKKEIDFDVLLPAICWHDIWRSQKFYNTKITFLYATLFDGLRSAKLFKKNAKNLLIDKTLIKQISYTIRKHSAIQLLPYSTLTSKILKELDLLDEWSIERLNIIENDYLKTQLISPRVIKIAKFYFDHFMMKSHQSIFCLPWTQNEFEYRKRDYIPLVKKLTEEYTK